jgi:AraC family transcriptional regulator
MSFKPKLVPSDVKNTLQIPSSDSGFILHEEALRHHWKGNGLLSVKSFFKGRAFYDTGKGLYAVDESCYLVLNDAQPYSIEIESEHPVESFCVFFKAGFAEDVFYSLNSKQEKLLDTPEPSENLKIGFFDRTYAHDDVLTPALLAVKTSFAEGKGDKGWLEELMHSLMQPLLQVHQKTSKELSSLKAVRASTREELYRRVARAGDFISAAFDQPITLNEIASVACLPPNHLLRSFRQIFRQSPHQFLTLKRLERAKKLLAETDNPVTDICFSVGYESLGSFSRLFRRRVGLSPEQYRRAKR